MSRRLLNACVAAVLSLGGWAGALASVVCPHAGGGARNALREHACCRAKLKAKAQSPKLIPAESPRRTSARRTARHGGCHAQTPPARAAEQRAGRQQHAAHDAPAPREAAAPRSLAAGARRPAARPATSCAHCVSRPELPPAPSGAREGEGPRRETAAAAGRGAPPPAARRPARHVCTSSSTAS
ncbi:MAG TPA: hypothetical protein VG148_00250 [Pyrinomonadaceae bacterium]|nr:hypothetical protein [Pyrinomonadaceae bacterium]